MVRKMMIVVLGTAFTFGAAAALDVGVGAFYSPGRVVGDATGIDEMDGVAGGGELNAGGFKGRVTLGVYEGLDLALGLGYNEFTYRDWTGIAMIPEADLVLSIPMLIFTAGADYEFPLSAIRPYVGGGGAFVRESAEAYRHTTTDWYGGVYVEGGARYFVGGSFAVEAAPRYTYLFDEPAMEYDGFNVQDFVRSVHHSQLVELLVGVNYYF
jgi:hypothetical protein